MLWLFYKQWVGGRADSSKDVKIENYIETFKKAKLKATESDSETQFSASTKSKCLTRSLDIYRDTQNCLLTLQEH